MMAESFSPLIIATLVFVGSHFLLSAGPVRGPLYARLGRWGFTGFYAVVALASFVWMCLAYRRAPFIDYWPREDWMWWLSLIITLAAAILLVCGYLSPNPASIIGDRALARENPAGGIFSVTRHPVLWAFTLWAAVHMLATGDAASLIFFGGIAALGLFGMMHIDARRDGEGTADWVRFREKTSLVPFVAIIQGRARLTLADMSWRNVLVGIVLWIVLVDGHEWIVSVVVAPWVANPTAG
jgi:uncharacterized membrane protein